MREIEFRGKRIDNGEWIYGYYTYEFDRGYHSESYDDVPQRCAYISNDSSCYEVHLKTVGQYTGLKDKNDKKIYEGDIVNFNEQRDKLYKVVYTGSGFKLSDIKYPNRNLHLLEDVVTWMIVDGNIH